MVERLGMNTERVSDLARRLHAQIGSLHDVCQTVDSAAAQSLSPLTWGIQPGGLILAPFSIAGTQWAAALTRGAANEAQLLTATLLKQIAEQLAASAAAPSGGTSGTSPSHRAEMGRALLDATKSPEEIMRLWAALSESERADLIRRYPREIGNTDGIPLGDRISAHREGARARLSDPTLSDGERAYLERVASGERALIVFDPESDRIVEMIGELRPETHTIITYVPGTGASLNGFYDGSAQQVAQYLVDRDNSNGTVAFVYKDGPWASWNPLSEHGNSRDEFANNRGADLARFQESLTREGLGGAARVGIAHSAGFSALTGSEVAGAEYDDVVSLGGSWIADGWSPRDGTDYAHYQYGFDAINYLNPGFDTPAESESFDQERFAPDTFDIFGVTFQNEVDNHLRIAEGPMRNQEALDDLRDRISR